MNRCSERSAARYAHSNPAHPDDVSSWEPLSGEDGHLARVEAFCSRFADRAFRGMPGAAAVFENMASLAARWHDLGKFSDAFQQYLLNAVGDSHEGERSGRVDHSSAGAQHAMSALQPPFNVMVAYAIAGHHAGLLDGNTGQPGCLKARLNKEGLPEWSGNSPEGLLQSPTLAASDLMPCLMPGKPLEVAFQLGFATRMLFSCLVDADFLATESFMNPEQATARPNCARGLISQCGWYNL